MAELAEGREVVCSIKDGDGPTRRVSVEEVKAAFAEMVDDCVARQGSAVGRGGDVPFVFYLGQKVVKVGCKR